jgi:hypothetical protein
VGMERRRIGQPTATGIAPTNGMGILPGRQQQKARDTKLFGA